MGQFSWISPIKIVFGPGAVAALGKEAQAFGSRVAVVTGKSGTARLAKEKVAPVLQGHVDMIHGVNPEPAVEDVLTLKANLERLQPDVVIAVGGGSVVDVTKLASSLVGNPGTIYEYLLSGAQLQRPGIPVIAVPTTAGAGSEVDCTSMIRIPERSLKRPVSQPLNGAKVAVVDPELTLGLPPYQTAISGADALTHALECYTSADYSPMSKSLAWMALTSIYGNYEEAVVHGDNLQARTEVMLGSVTAGVAMLNKGLGVVHAVAHALAGHYTISHGHLCGALLPHAIRLNAETAPQGYAEVARMVGGGSVPADDRAAANWLADYTAAMFLRCGVEPKVHVATRLEAMPWDTILDALKYSKSLALNARPVNVTQCRELLERVLLSDAADPGAAGRMAG